MKKLEQIFLSTDILIEAIDGLERALEWMGRLPTEVSRWKWVIISLDNSFQNWALAAVRDSVGGNILSFRNPTEAARYWVANYKRWGFSRSEIEEYFPNGLPKKVARALDNGEDLNPPPEYLVNFPKLLNLIQGPGMQRYGGSSTWSPGAEELRAVEWLHELRNNFIHFIPRGWSLDVTGLPRICQHVCAAIKFLAFDSNTLFLEEKREYVSHILSDIEQELERLNQFYEDVCAFAHDESRPPKLPKESPG